MKNTKYIKYLFGVLLIISAGSCKKGYLEGVNTNPNQPSSITPAVALPSSEGAIAYALGGDMSRFNSIFMQYVTGVARQMQNFNNYSFTEDDFNNLWLGGLYAGPMNNLKTQIAICDKSGYKYYSGISKVLMAYSLGMVTDTWGDAPYSEAFQGINKLQPKFDSQQSLYSSIQKLLSDAIVDLSVASTSAGAFKPGAEDIIYAGSAAKWKKFAYALSARFYIHVSKFDASAAQKALDAINAGAFTASSDDAQFVFGTTATTAGPWFQYNDQRGDLSFTGYMVDEMTTLNDPRLDIYIDVANDLLGDYLGASDAPVYFMTYFEQKFIEAEAYNRIGDDVSAQAAYVAAITANMQKVGVAAADIATYLAANGILTGTTQAEKLDEIMVQKYFAMFLQPEAWSDWRRTGSPALAPNTGNVLGSIPRRYLYPQSERSYNAANTPHTNLLSKMWWDQ